MPRQHVDQDHVAQQALVGAALDPGGVALGIRRPILIPQRRTFELKAEDGARQLPIERGRELRGRRAQRALHAFAFGLAHLTDPAVLEPGQGRHQQQHDRDQSGDARDPSSKGVHETQSSMQKWR